MENMQTALMHEERIDRPDDGFSQENPSGRDMSESGDSANDHAESSLEAGGLPDNDLTIFHANREAERRKSDTGSAAPRGTQPIFEPTRTSVGPRVANDPTDESLFLRYKEGDDRAFFAIYERYKESIYAYCAHVLFSAGFTREIVEDTFQDVFMRLVQYRHTFTGGEFRPWLFTVTRHSCLTAKRKTYRESQTEERARDIAASEYGYDEVRQGISNIDDPLEQMSKEEQTRLLLAAIAKLPDEFREVLILSEYEELTYEEIGKMLGASLSTIRIRIFRAKGRLRKMLLPVLSEGNE